MGTDAPRTRRHRGLVFLTALLITVLVLGMGRVGQAAYRELSEEHGFSVVGIENATDRVERLRAQGIDVQEADATDQEFWERVIATGHVQVAVLATVVHRP